MPFIQASDATQLFYSDFGQGEPIVFTHAWALSSDMFAYLIAPLVRAGYRCIAFDRRGHGRSDVPRSGYGYDTLGDDLACVMERLELRGVTLVGHSMGTGENVRYLSRHGCERVARLVLIAPTIPLLPRTPDNPDGIAPEQAQANYAALLRDVPEWCEVNRAAFFGERVVSPGVGDWVIRQIVQTPLMVLLETLAGFGEDFRAELQKITIPSLILQGDRDASAPLELTGRKAAALMPQARLVVYEGAGHGLFVTDHERLTTDILNFIRGRAAVSG